jgi:sulfhydrogenase subunit beta (sulfur reductase)
MEQEIKLLQKESFIQLIQHLLDRGQQVYAPTRQGGKIGYSRISQTDEVLTGDYPLPKVSAKSIIFPRVEKLFSYSKSKEGVVTEDFNADKVPYKVVIGLRPCDAAGFVTIDTTFSAAPADFILKTRMDRTTVIGVSCATADDYCFCTSIGGGPGNKKGSDILLTQIKNGDYLAEILTEKGEKILNEVPELFGKTGGDKKGDHLANVPVKFDQTHLYDKINAAFNTGIFDEQAMRCIGCGACAYVCPTCTCFDIQDETKGPKGQRLRCWDTCGSKLFTLHTSGHNPRSTQGQRWRQRLMHKFSYLNDNLNLTGCEGCGRCSRNCPADMNLAEHLKQITELS